MISLYVDNISKEVARTLPLLSLLLAILQPVRSDAPIPSLDEAAECLLRASEILAASEGLAPKEVFHPLSEEVLW